MSAADGRRAFRGLADPAMLLATWFGAGLLPKAPGTWGSLAALPFAWAIAWLLGPAGLAAASLALFLAGIWAAGRAARDLGAHDPPCVVVDEVAGQWLALAAAPLDPWFYAAGFVLFRLFDIWKPPPVSWAERLDGGLGIMTDDAIAALYAALLLSAGRLLLGR